ncbi:MAG: M56 family metallopeptidase [Verrucomicrobiota bacterium]
MADLFWAYWDASLRFALLAFLLLLATPLLKKILSPRLLCWAWALLLVRLAIPFSLPHSSSIFNWHESIQPSSWTNAIRQGVVDAGLGETLLPVWQDQDDLFIATKIGISWENALVFIWALGAIAMSVHLALNVLRLHRFFKKADKLHEGELYELFKDTRRRYGIHSNVPLLISDDVKTPGIAGIFNPRVVLPRKCAEDLSASELRCVFLHELTHFRRGDLFMHHALLLICYMHWYNPLVWFVLKQFKASMEQACDEDVVDSVCIETAREYGYTLLQVAEHSTERCASPAGALCLLGSRKSGELKERIVRIANPKRRNPFLGCVAIGMFGASFMFAMTGEQEGFSEAERLIRLTKISGMDLFQVHGNAPEGNSFLIESDLPAGATLWKPVNAPRATRTLDVSIYKGQKIRLKAILRSGQLLEDIELWAGVQDSVGSSLAYETGASRASPGDLRRAFSELTIDVAEEAAAINYGWSADGSGSVWFEDLEVEVLGPLAISE